MQKNKSRIKTILKEISDKDFRIMQLKEEVNRLEEELYEYEDLSAYDL